MLEVLSTGSSTLVSCRKNNLSRSKVAGAVVEMAVSFLVVAVMGRIGSWWMRGLYRGALAVLGCLDCIEVYWGKPPISAPATVSPDWCRTGRRLYITHTKSQISDLKEIDFS